MTDTIDEFLAQWGQQRSDGGWPPPLPEDIQYIYRIARVCKLLGDRLDATCERHGLTRSQFEAMAVLRRRYPEPLSAGDLMQAAFLTSGSVTAMLNQLQDRGWVIRQPAAQDRRRIEVQLTLEGIRRIEPAIAERIADNTAIARSLPDEARAQIDRPLRQLLAALEARSSIKEAS